MIVYVANGVLSARRLQGAGVDATLILTGQVCRALVVVGALGAIARQLGVAEVTGCATTGRAMILTIALGIDRTLVLQNTRVDALVVVAGVGVATVAVQLAFHCSKDNNNFSIFCCEIILFIY